MLQLELEPTGSLDRQVSSLNGSGSKEIQHLSSQCIAAPDKQSSWFEGASVTSILLMRCAPRSRGRERESKWTIHQLIHQPPSRAPHWFEIPRLLHHASLHFLLLNRVGRFTILLHQNTVLYKSKIYDKRYSTNSTPPPLRVYRYQYR